MVFAPIGNELAWRLSRRRSLPRTENPIHLKHAERPELPGLSEVVTDARFVTNAQLLESCLELDSLATATVLPSPPGVYLRQSARR